MKTTWLKGLNAKEKDEMKSSFLASSLLRQKGIAICRDKINTLRKARRSEAAYESPNWAYQQADLAGYERALEEVISLLE